MYYVPYSYGYPYYPQHHVHPYSMQPHGNAPNPWPQTNPAASVTPTGQKGQDYGRQPYVTQIRHATLHNHAFRTAIWTGRHMQVTVMSIPVGEDIGLERHTHADQFIKIEQGQAMVQMGDRRDQLTYRRRVSAGDAILIPAGKWHNITNTGRTPLKLFSVYAPPEHPFGTVHQTKKDAMAAEHSYS